MLITDEEFRCPNCGSSLVYTEDDKFEFCFSCNQDDDDLQGE